MNSEYRHRFAIFTAVSVLAVSFVTGCAQHPKNETQNSNISDAVERKYVVSDIIRSYNSPKSLADRVDEWNVCVTANIEPGSWNTEEFSISADQENECILAKCNNATHDRIHALLEDIRKMNHHSKP